MIKNFSRLSVVFLGLSVAAVAQQSTPGTPGIAVRRAVINFTELAKREALVASPAQQTRQAHPALRPAGKLRSQSQAQITTAAIEASASLAPLPSPAPTASFLALFDDGSTIPPDTMGTVGPNHVMTTLNSQVRIQTRTGTILSTVSLESFWASLGQSEVFDPHITYDPFNDRWIFSASSNSDLPSAAILVGVSESSDPTGNWFLFKADADADNLTWPDFDALGFNKNWIVVTANMFGNHGGSLHGVWVWAFDKADLYANGAGAFTLLKFVDNDPNFFTFAVSPARMLDNSLDTMYLVEDWDGTSGELRVSTITGPVGSEVLTSGDSFPATANHWEFFGGKDFLPQLGSARGIDAGDSRLQSCLYRNGSLWVSHTTFVPPGTPTRAVAQWWQVSTNGTVQQFGRVEDPSGNRHYAYPSLAVNANGDMLLGYSRFSKSQYASGNYSFRFSTDAPNALRADTVLHAGEAPYFVSDGNANRWGDYSGTSVDPNDDLTFWTIQEYAGKGNNWSTWWGRIAPDLSSIKLALTRPADGLSYPPNPTVTLTATSFDTNTTFTKVEFFADGTKVGEDTTEPFTTTWFGATVGSHDLNAIGMESGGGVSTSAVVVITVGDTASPIGTWETKLSGSAKGTAILSFNDDFTITGHGMKLGTFGLFDITGAWNFDSKHLTAASYAEILDGITNFSGSFVAKVTTGKKFAGTVASALKLKGVPRQPVPDLSGNWSANVKTGDSTMMESYTITASPTLLNVFDVTGSVTGSILETAKGQINIVTDGGATRSLAGKAKPAAFSAKGTDLAGDNVILKATKP